MRINSAKDDAAGLQIADRLTSQINGLNQGNRNASDGIALAQTIESSLDEVSSMMQKIRTLAVQASNGTNTTEDRAALGKEASALVAEMGRIAQQATYGGKKILDGAYKDSIYATGATGNASKGGTMTLQVGSNKGDTITFSVNNYKFSHMIKGASAGFAKGKQASKGDTITFAKFSDAQNMIESMDKLIAKVDGERANLGAIQNHGFPAILLILLYLAQFSQSRVSFW